MGNGGSVESSKIIHIKVNDKHEKIVFGRNCSSRDLRELLAHAAGVSRLSEIVLKDQSGALVTVAPSMPNNDAQTPYNVIVEREVPLPTGNEEGAFKNVLNHVAEQFSEALKVDEFRTEVNKRLNTLESRIEKDNQRGVEIEKCRKDISDIRNQIFEAQTKIVDYNHMRPNYFQGKSTDRFYASSSTDEHKIVMKRDIPKYPKYTLSEETVAYLKQPTFDIWHWEPNEMLSLLEHMYHELDIVHEFNINPVNLKRWLLCIQENYRNNPFHNFRHCFCVTQMMYGMIHICELWETLTKEDLGILITACICHDLDHPGYNNTYQINARTDLAILYNDISPLENHHCAVAFQILNNPECNIFGNVDKDTFKRIRANITMLILGTDMARHGEVMDKFKRTLTDFDYNNKEHLDLLKMVLVKCCDISNEVRPAEVSEPWVDCLLEEYFNQSDREKLEGLPVAPFMDREKVTKPTAQIGFIKFVLIPMFETVAKLFPIVDTIMVEKLRMARDHYEEMKLMDEALKETDGVD
ncbi:high affinity cGMP-specific 3',5'-cyclic phosphodiesterase 9A isoform X2 [Lingula anatina]|uniref:Phosphodiesterase n=1 Tax=Lingula anatina TaxID=7574 RepID=A0A1S3I3R4_LINAN|nr:high affinity cGMP-specific 3',5'-cyclic phosphodiesterase 9A isoform X2 [Lingula anatina]|eukprot:XP_013391999.1 high affinity cGMP-specific 3',5'-cyclic phosphodiesterase 9A isoform X2 [Lingula anatina]